MVQNYRTKVGRIRVLHTNPPIRVPRTVARLSAGSIATLARAAVRTYGPSGRSTSRGRCAYRRYRTSSSECCTGTHVHRSALLQLSAVAAVRDGNTTDSHRRCCRSGCRINIDAAHGANSCWGLRDGRWTNTTASGDVRDSHRLLATLPYYIVLAAAAPALALIRL